MSNQYHSGPWTGFRTQYDLALQKSICSTCDMPVMKYNMPKSQPKPKEKFAMYPNFVPRKTACSNR